MSWWVVAAAAIVVVVVAWAATSWLLSEASAAKDPGAARVDAIKTGLGIGAGTTGIFALLLAVRRQWHNESDATEKNVTDLYTKAADQLGSAEAPVRLAGLYALERLAHNNPGQRQSIVNVICAYLRMPYMPPDATLASDSTELQERIQEREVRLAGQRILTDHLAPQDRRKFWGDIDIDLTNAHLIEFTLEDCKPRNGRFSGATFGGASRFRNTTFTGGAWFDDAIFTHEASFDGVIFTRDAWFNGATFGEDAEFNNAMFAGEVGFGGATFTGVAWFGDVTFTDNAWFNDLTFTRDAWFADSTFTRGVLFNGTAFTGEARFSGATFLRAAAFGDVIFASDARLTATTFSREAWFSGATFVGEASFGKATFAGDASFDTATFASALPRIDRPLAETATFANAILTSYSPDRTAVAGIVVDVRGTRATPDEVEVRLGPQSPT